MPKPRRIAQRRREKKKMVKLPEYQKRLSDKELYQSPGLKNYFDKKDATPLNVSLKARGLTDEDGGGFIYG